TFMVVSGVFFLRVIYAFLRVFPGGTPGLADDMSGPTNLVVAFASYLMPLAVLELYFLAQRSANPSAKLACSMLVLVMAGATSLGVYN
uniref:hypothetical protein n=1 Tax=Vibrio vulnificus TaxID=672 RepID=UPI0019D4202B